MVVHVALRNMKHPTGQTRLPWFEDRARELYNDLQGICGGLTGSTLNYDKQIKHSNRNDGEEEFDDGSVNSNLDETLENV